MPAFRRLLLAAASALALAACAGDVNPVRDTLVDAGLGAKTRTAPDFIERSRPENLDYLPVGVAQPPRRTEAKSEEEVRRASAEMEATRGRNAAQAASARQAAGTLPPRP